MDRRLAIVAVAVVAVAALFFVLRPGGDDEATTTEASTDTTTTATTEPGPTTTAAATAAAPEAIPWRIDARDERLDRLRVPADASVVITVVAATTDHVHLHGYDLMADVAPGSPARLRFAATITGRFEIELEDGGQEIAQLTVVP